MEDFDLNNEDGEVIKPKRPAPKTAWVKGQSGNPNGRPKGSKNKTTQQMRDYLHQILSGQLEGIEYDLENMSNFNRMLIFEKLLKYAMPTLSKNELGGEVNSNIKIEVSYEDKQTENED